jgi:tetratricopeptide (TPR) repeat protein
VTERYDSRLSRRVALIITTLALALCARAATASEYEGDPEAARPINERAVQAYQAGSFADAARLFQEAYQAYSHPEFLYNRAQSERRAGRFRDALATYQNYVTLSDEPTPNVYLHMGDCMLGLNRPPLAANYYHRYLENEMFGTGAARARLALATDTPCSGHDEATVQQVQQAYEEALETYRTNTPAAAQALIQSADRLHVPELLYNAAGMYQLDQMWAQAAQTFRRYVAAGHPRLDAWVDLASCLLMQNDNAGAREAAERYLQLAPNGDAAQDARDIISAAGGGAHAPSAGDRARAAEITREAERLYRAGELRQAIAQYRAANAIVPSRANLFNICMCYTADEDWPNAALQWEEYLRGGDQGNDAVGHVFAAQAYYMSHNLDLAGQHVQAYVRMAEQHDLPGAGRNLRYLHGLTRDIERELRAGGGR